ncbi:hypothetical protein [Streptomyces exfoliatus]|uniref:hypothetical protein n=1 Tax=Streptomyces exfoliatus TaxID=1905 RepID=UPI0004B71C43|nr:hypothetical protein [Streptomyces exfoliatus]
MRFPEPPAAVAECVAERSVATSLADCAAPWDLGALGSELLGLVLGWLDESCRWLNATYAWLPEYVIPPCWADHERLAYEVAALAFARIEAYEEPGAVILWHEQYDRFITRMNAALGKAGDDCRVGKHDRRPARFALQAWPSSSAADPVEYSAISALSELSA